MNNLDVGERKTIRVSHSEPVSAPPGHKVLATAMEIGLIRDFVDKSVGLHDRLLESESLIGKAYGLGWTSVYYGSVVAGKVRKVGNKVFVDVMPSGVVQTSLDTQLEVWHRWVNLDETLSSKVSDQLQHHPLLRKTPGEVVDDVESAVTGSRIWKGTKTVVDSVNNFIQRFFNSEKHNGRKDEESSDENKDVPEPFLNEPTDEAKKRRRKKSRGLTKGSREAHDESGPLVVES